jgi:PD-(D/E)XK nuclease superfamily protein
MAPGRGSLGEVLPESFKVLFSRAASAFPECPNVAWTGRSGRVFEFRICKPPPTSDRGSLLDACPQPLPSDLLGPSGVAVLPHSASVSDWLSRSDAAGSADVSRELAIGRLVHRIFQFGRLNGSGVGGALDFGHTLLDDEDRLVLDDPGAAIAEACRVWRAMCAQPAVAELLAQGRRLHELPFSMAKRHGLDAGVLRGTIDCLVERPDGSIVVLEFKTGKPRDDHRRQLELYVQAARSLFPGTRVSGQLVYP